MTPRFALASASAVALVSPSVMVKQAAPWQEIGKGEGRVDIVVRVVNIERGASSRDIECVPGFERNTDCKVMGKAARPTRGWC